MGVAICNFYTCIFSIMHMYMCACMCVHMGACGGRHLDTALTQIWFGVQVGGVPSQIAFFTFGPKKVCFLFL